MRVVFVLSSFLPFSKAGSELYILNLATHLQNRGIKVSVITPVIKKIADYKYGRLDVHTFPEQSIPNKKIYAGLRPPSGLTRFETLLKSIKPDIVHFNNNNRLINSYHIQTAVNLGIKTIFTSHLSGIFCVKDSLMYLNRERCNGKVKLNRCMRCYLHNMGFNQFMARAMSLVINVLVVTRLYEITKPSLGIVKRKKNELKKIGTISDGIISLSDWIMETYKLNGIDHSVLIKQTVPLADENTGVYTDRKDNIINILFLGRISIVKGIDLLVDAIKGDYEDHFNLVIAGLKLNSEQTYYQQIRKKISELKHSQWFEDLSREEITLLMKSSDLLCLPSIVAEMAPLVIQEAFLSGVPVIASAHAGIADMVKHQYNGLLFEPGSIGGLKIQLESLINEPELLAHLSKNIPKPDPYEGLIDNHVKLYTDILKND